MKRLFYKLWWLFTGWGWCECGVCEHWMIAPDGYTLENEIMCDKCKNVHPSPMLPWWSTFVPRWKRG